MRMCSFLSARSGSCGVIKFLEATTLCTHRDATCDAVSAHGCPGHEWRSSITPYVTNILLLKEVANCWQMHRQNCL